MARTKAQLLLRRLKRTPFKRGRLLMGKYCIDILATGKRYVSVNHTPKLAGRWSSAPGAQRSSTKALRQLIRSEHGKKG